VRCRRGRVHGQEIEDSGHNARVPVYAAAEVRHWDFPRSPAGVALLVEYGVERGLRPADLLSGTGLDEAELHDPQATITARQELAVAANVVALLPDEPALGWSAGRRYHVGVFGIFGYACLTSPTLGDAVRFAISSYELSFGFCLPSVTVSGDVATLELHLPELTGPVARFLVERDLSAMLTMITDVLGEPAPVLAAAFAFPAPPDAGALGELIGLRPAYDAPATAVAFPAELLERRLPQASPLTVALCEAQCREMISRRRARGATADAVRAQLIRIDRAPRTIATVARSLAMSERTLRRRLASENTTFRQLSDEVHRTLAEEMLATGALSVDDVAIRLGFAEASTFIAAFRRWTGTTPARYRRATVPAGRR
jgi:AraC-like DNA-binding protein